MPASFHSDYLINTSWQGQSCFGARGNFHRLTHYMQKIYGKTEQINKQSEQRAASFGQADSNWDAGIKKFSQLMAERAQKLEQMCQKAKSQ